MKRTLIGALLFIMPFVSSCDSLCTDYKVVYISGKDPVKVHVRKNEGINTHVFSFSGECARKILKKNSKYSIESCVDLDEIRNYQIECFKK